MKNKLRMIVNKIINTMERKLIFKKIPVIGATERIMLRVVKNTTFPGSKNYWEERYARGETSGRGSYGKVAEFKAEIINSFVKENDINMVIEFGCGDSNQLSLFIFPNYIGLDVSKTAIKLCTDRFKNDNTKQFFLYDSERFEDKHFGLKAELALSIDVIYHLVEDNIFESHMKHLFLSSDKFVIIYSTDIDTKQIGNERQRQFTKWVKTNLPGWKLIKKIKNRCLSESNADFFVYKKAKL